MAFFTSSLRKHSILNYAKIWSWGSVRARYGSKNCTPRKENKMEENTVYLDQEMKFGADGVPAVKHAIRLQNGQWVRCGLIDRYSGPQFSAGAVKRGRPREVGPRKKMQGNKKMKQGVQRRKFSLQLEPLLIDASSTVTTRRLYARRIPLMTKTLSK